MKSKNISSIILLVVIIIVGFLSFKFIFNGPSENGSQISLLTNPNPPRIGQTNFTITVKDRDGKTVDNAKVSFDLNMTTMDMGSQQGEATTQGNGQYAAAGRLSMGGPWAVKTKISMPNGEVVSKDFTLSVY